MSVVVISGLSEAVPEIVVDAKRRLLDARGFANFEILGAVIAPSADTISRTGWTQWYIDVSLVPAVTFGDIKDMAESIFDHAGSQGLLPARWHYIPTTSIVCVVQEWSL